MSPGPDLGSLDNPTPNAVTAQTVNITTLNVTYGGDGYNGSIHNGYVGGRRNEYYSESRSCMLAVIITPTFQMSCSRRVCPDTAPSTLR